MRTRSAATLVHSRLLLHPRAMHLIVRNPPMAAKIERGGSAWIRRRRILPGVVRRRGRGVVQPVAETSHHGATTASQCLVSSRSQPFEVASRRASVFAVSISVTAADLGTDRRRRPVRPSPGVRHLERGDRSDSWQQLTIRHLDSSATASCDRKIQRTERVAQALAVVAA